MKAQYQDLDEYIEDLRATIAKTPDCANHLYNLGLALLSKRDFFQAEQAFLDALRKSPRLAEAYVQLGGICLQRGDLEGCLNYNKEAAECRPRFAIAHGNMGFVHLQRGDAEKAIESFTKAIKWDPNFTQALASLADRLLTCLDALPLGAKDRAVLTAARSLRHVDLKKLLAAYPRTVARLAAGRGKLVAPFAVEGETVPVDPARFGPLAKTLVHAFRNAVDHGLETPDERSDMGKTETGTISCRVHVASGWATIEVADDGRGVDVEAIRSRAFERGLAGAEELAAMDDAALEELLFRDGFSSRREVGDLSGRGVGLAAVRAEAERWPVLVRRTGARSE